MKIAIVTDAIYPFMMGGSEIRNYEVAKRLVKKGHEVHIFGAQLWSGSKEREMDGIKIHGVSPYSKCYGYDGKRSIMEPLKLSFKMFFELKKYDFDIIENATFVYFNCYSTRLVSWMKRTPLVFLWHQYFGKYLLKYFGFLKGFAGICLELSSTLLSKHNLCVSNKIRGDLVNRFVPKKNCEVIYNGVDLKLMGESVKKDKKYDLIYVGRFNYQKNLEMLFEAVSILKKEGLKISVGIIGSGSEEEKLRLLASQLKIKKNITFLGKILDKKEVFGHMKSSKVFVLPSRLEGFPLTVIEANAAGLPIITTNTKYNNVSEYVVEGENGLLSSLDPKDFSAKIKLLLKDELLRKKLSRKGIEKSKDFSWEKITEQLENYYSSLLI